MTMDDDRARYLAAAHAMQSGVAKEMVLSPATAAATQKHLRVGLNSAMADQGGLAQLLIEKGVFTRAEYFAAVADSMEQERAKYEALLSAQLGVPVTLK